MKIYQKMLRIYWSDSFHEKVYVTDWLPEAEALELYRSYKSNEEEPDDYGQGYYEGYWKFYSYDEKFEELEQKAIANGIPLPKGHGRIGDLDAIKKEMQNYHDDCAKTSEYTRLGFETAIAKVESEKKKDEENTYNV